MAKSKRVPGGAPGDWYVDDRCIDCGAVRHIAPGLFVARGGYSVLIRQPQNDEERRLVWLAAELCPTRSVRSESGERPPEGLYPHELQAGVYLCGFNSRASYGAHSYFVTRQEGNLLVDSPVFTKKLVRPFEDMGGIAKVFLSHRDDVADADKWAAHFGADVYIHDADRDAAPFATHVLGGATPADATDLGDGLTFIPLPGHTRGSASLLTDDGALFSGDSLCWRQGAQELHAFRDACWFSWDVQRASLDALTAYDFVQVFSGHGSWSPRLDAERMRDHLRTLVEKM